MKGDYVDKKPFDIKNVEECINRICDAMDGFTLMERWWALRSLEASARAMLGEKAMEFVQLEEERMRSSEPIDVPAEN